MLFHYLLSKLPRYGWLGSVHISLNCSTSTTLTIIRGYLPSIFPPLVTRVLLGVEPAQKRLSQIHNIGNNGNIAICVLPHISGFLLLYSNCIVQVNAIFYITAHKRNTFQCWLLWRSSKFQMAQVKYKWQYCYTCIAESLWKPRMGWVKRSFDLSYSYV